MKIRQESDKSRSNISEGLVADSNLDKFLKIPDKKFT